jgi:hypothetical protein
MPLPEELVAREGQTLTFLYGWTRSSNTQKLVAILNHTTEESIGPNRRALAKLFFDPDPDPVTRAGLSIMHKATLGIGIIGLLGAIFIFIVLLLSAIRPTQGSPNDRAVGFAVGFLLCLLMGVAAWIPHICLCRYAWRLMQPYLEQRERTFRQLLRHCCYCCELLANLRY